MRFNVVAGPAARCAAVSAVILGLAAVAVTPAAAVTHAAAGPSPYPGAPPTPGLAHVPAQQAFPAGLWRPADGTGPWGPIKAAAMPPAVRPGPAPLGSPAPGGPWRLQPSPDPVVHNGMLLSDSCTSPGICVAVGGYENTHGTQVTLAQARTRTGWRILRTPTPAGAVLSNLFGVSCAAPRACTAVGYYIDAARLIHPLAERWNGTAWSLQAVPSPAGYPKAGLFAVSCPTATTCTAVGAQSIGNVTTPLAEAWNGTAWRVQPVAGPAGSLASELLAVSCSAPAACTAVGSDVGGTQTSAPLVERWNGTAWAVQAVPSPAGSPGSGFSGVSCPTATACTAAGSYATGGGNAALLAEAWNGTSWQIQATPAPAGSTGSEFLAVSCSAPGACTAAGATTISVPASGSGAGVTVSLAERWNGATWRVQATPNPGRSSGTGYAAVSCSAAAACTAAGSYTTASLLNRPTAAAWGGTTWHQQATPSWAGATVNSGLIGVSCATPRACTAAGSATDTMGESTTLAERWDGTRWRIQPAPVPAGAVAAGFSGVSCPTPVTCTAVGQYADASQQELALAERWAGGRWQIQRFPRAAIATRGSQLTGVSCSTAHSCMASGWYFTRSGTVSFTAAWDGSRWRAQPAPGPLRAGLVFGVACASPAACVAVGDHGTAVWDGTRWRYAAVAVPSGAQSVTLNGVTCLSATACTAVGSYFGTVGAQLTLAETWNGTAWRIQATPTPSPGRNQLNTVACNSPSDCTAVGVEAPDDFTPAAAFSETWDGIRWRLVPVPVPAGTVLAELFGVACPAACYAVGTDSGPSGIGVTLALTTAGR